MVPANNSFRPKKPSYQNKHPASNATSTYLPVCFNASIILVWKTWSTDSTVTVVPDCGIANTSMTCTVYSSTNSPSMRPMTSIGTPARPCFNIYHFFLSLGSVLF